MFSEVWYDMEIEPGRVIHLSFNATQPRELTQELCFENRKEARAQLTNSQEV